jgi:hypothetical protein
MEEINKAIVSGVTDTLFRFRLKDIESEGGGLDAG